MKDLKGPESEEEEPEQEEFAHKIGSMPTGLNFMMSPTRVEKIDFHNAPSDDDDFIPQLKSS